MTLVAKSPMFLFSDSGQQEESRSTPARDHYSKD